MDLPEISLEETVKTIEFIFLISGTLFCLELYFLKGNIFDKGLLNQSFVKLFASKKEKKLINALSFLFKKRVVLPFLCIYLVLIYLLFIDFKLIHKLLVVSLLFFLQVLINYRLKPFHSASLQMRLIILGGLFFYYFNADFSGKIFSLYFISFQSLAAYFFSGILKTGTKSWIDGSAIINIIKSKARGDNIALVNWLNRNKSICVILSISTLIFECCAPFLFLLGPAGAYLFICLGILFHLIISSILGFNDFLFTFIAPYPAIIYCSQHFVTIMN